MNEAIPNRAVSRRGILLGTAATVIATITPAWAAPAADGALQSRFMRLSTLLVNHRLAPEVGARIAAFAATQHPDLPALIDGIIAVADKKNATSVEDFFADIPDGPSKDFAHWVIFAWYSGVSAPVRKAQLFTFEKALTFQTTADVTAIPSYGLAAPDRWSQTTVPLGTMPTF